MEVGRAGRQLAEAAAVSASSRVGGSSDRARNASLPGNSTCKPKKTLKRVVDG